MKRMIIFWWTPCRRFRNSCLDGEVGNTNMTSIQKLKNMTINGFKSTAICLKGLAQATIFKKIGDFILAY